MIRFFIMNDGNSVKFDLPANELLERALSSAL